MAEQRRWGSAFCFHLAPPLEDHLIDPHVPEETVFVGSPEEEKPVLADGQGLMTKQGLSKAQ